jgi:hypothetical protein
MENKACVMKILANGNISWIDYTKPERKGDEKVEVHFKNG